MHDKRKAKKNLYVGNTLLMLMVKIPCDSAHELEDIMELLVQYGADTACPNKEGKTPLILAVEKVNSARSRQIERHQLLALRVFCAKLLSSCLLELQ